MNHQKVNTTANVVTAVCAVAFTGTAVAVGVVTVAAGKGFKKAVEAISEAIKEGPKDNGDAIDV